MTHQEMVIRMLKNPKVSEELARLNKNEFAALDKKISKKKRQRNRLVVLNASPQNAKLS